MYLISVIQEKVAFIDEKKVVQKQKEKFKRGENQRGKK